MKIAQRTVLIKATLWAFFICFGVLQAQALPGPTYWLCRRGMEVRTLRIQKKETSCVAWYTKEGLDDMVADSKEASLCDSIVTKIKGTLESAGWKCKDISSSQITD